MLHFYSSVTTTLIRRGLVYIPEFLNRDEPTGDRRLNPQDHRRPIITAFWNENLSCWLPHFATFFLFSLL